MSLWTIHAVGGGRVEKKKKEIYSLPSTPINQELFGETNPRKTVIASKAFAH